MVYLYSFLSRYIFQYNLIYKLVLFVYILMGSVIKREEIRVLEEILFCVECGYAVEKRGEVYWCGVCLKDYTSEKVCHASRDSYD